TLRFFLLLPNHLVRDFKADDGRRFIGWQYKPGQRLQVRLPVEHWTDRIVLPAEAVVQDGAEMFVFREDGKHFDRMPVHVEYRDPQWAVIADDGSLKVGEQIAMAGAAQLQLALKNRSGGAVDPHAGHNH
ncbi:MAG TPA: efflux RND transporter periplasmic adaptor subunit, partial [Pirellulales bacterium]|nr:efflux RND transporter periplasmic adaptor subunit [Pirellulales bacterium]